MDVKKKNHMKEDIFLILYEIIVIIMRYITFILLNKWFFFYLPAVLTSMLLHLFWFLSFHINFHSKFWQNPTWCIGEPEWMTTNLMFEIRTPWIHL